MKFAVKNVSLGARLIQVKKGHHVSLPSGREEVLELTPYVARRHMEAAARKPGKYMHITPLDDEARDALAGAPAPVLPDPGVVVAVTDEQPKVAAPDARAAATELVLRVDSTDINLLRSEARMVLGSRWPRNAGNINRERIKDMLTAMATDLEGTFETQE